MITTFGFNKLISKDPKIKYGFTKELLKTGANMPESLYDHFEHFTEMLKSDNNIIKWTAIDIIGYLSAVDKDNKTDKKINDLIRLLHGGKLITCNHAIFALGLIAHNKHKHRKKIFKELLAISKDEFETDECKNIATGKVLDTIKSFLIDIKNDKAVIEFIKNATKSRRNSTKKKAEQLLQRLKKM
ncbi:MAG: hypothetical protein HY738_01780 [Bacteroidia bacterium]|nr:hypothetical protein [Bacteroidia bacterium]